MKVLAINGSARKNGNTDILISRIFDKLNAAGIDSESVRFEGNIIEPCKACFACGDKENCIHKKDQFAETFEKMKNANGIILGSPVYVANISANMQAFLERAAVVCDMNPGLMKHKIGVSIASVRRGGALCTLDAMHHFFLSQEMFVVGSSYWNMAYGELSGDVLKDKEGIANIDNLAENMVWLLKKIEQEERS